MACMGRACELVTGGLGIQGGEEERVMTFVGQEPLNGLVAQGALSVKEQNGATVSLVPIWQGQPHRTQGKGPFDVQEPEVLESAELKPEADAHDEEDAKVHHP